MIVESKYSSKKNQILKNFENGIWRFADVYSNGKFKTKGDGVSSTLEIKSANIAVDAKYNFDEKQENGEFTLMSKGPKSAFVYTINVAEIFSAFKNGNSIVNVHEVTKGGKIEIIPENAKLVLIADQAISFEKLDVYSFLSNEPKLNENMLKIGNMALSIDNFVQQSAQNSCVFGFLIFRKNAYINSTGSKSKEYDPKAWIKFNPEFFTEKEQLEGLEKLNRPIQPISVQQQFQNQNVAPQAQTQNVIAPGFPQYNANQQEQNNAAPINDVIVKPQQNQCAHPEDNLTASFIQNVDNNNVNAADLMQNDSWSLSNPLVKYSLIAGVIVFALLGVLILVYIFKSCSSTRRIQTI